MVEIVQALGADAEAQGATVTWDAAAQRLRVEAAILPGLTQFLELAVSGDAAGSAVEATVGLSGPLLDLGAVVIEQSQLDEAAQELATAVAGAELAAPAAPAAPEADALGV